MTANRTIQPSVENSDMNRWSSANTWSRSTDKPVEILGPLVVLDGRDRCLQRRDVGFERDGDLVAESTLRPVEHDFRNHVAVADAAEPERGDHDATAIVLIEAVGEELEPQRDQRVGQRHHDRHRERQEQAARLGAVAELTVRHSELQRRRQVVR